MRADRGDSPGEVAFLLIGEQEGASWPLALAEALAPLGRLRIVSEREVFEEVDRTRYDMIIVDTTAVKEVASLVARLHAQQPEVRMVVATLSPTWQRARKAMQAGASDYIRKSLNKEETLDAIRDILKLQGSDSTG